MRSSSACGLWAMPVGHGRCASGSILRPRRGSLPPPQRGGEPRKRNMTHETTPGRLLTCPRGHVVGSDSCPTLLKLPRLTKSYRTVWAGLTKTGRFIGASMAFLQRPVRASLLAMPGWSRMPGSGGSGGRPGFSRSPCTSGPLRSLIVTPKAPLSVTFVTIRAAQHLRCCFRFMHLWAAWIVSCPNSPAFSA